MKVVISIIITKAVVIVIKIKVVALMEVDELTQQEVMDQDQREEERFYLQGTNRGSGAHESDRKRNIREIRREMYIVIESKHWEIFKELVVKRVVILYENWGWYG